MNKKIIGSLFLILSSFTFGERVKVDIRSDIPGVLYIENEKIKDIDLGDIYSGRYESGFYTFTLKNTRGIYQKNITIGSGENKIFFTEKDLVKKIQEEKPKVIVKTVVKEKIVEVPIYIKEEVKEVPSEKNIEKQESPKIEKQISKDLVITQENFNKILTEYIINLKGYEINTTLKKYTIEPNEETERNFYLIGEDGERLSRETYDYGRIEELMEKGLVVVEYSFKIKDEFYNSLVNFFLKFKILKTYGTDNLNYIKTNDESYYMGTSTYGDFVGNNIFEKLYEYSYLNKKEVKKYGNKLLKIEISPQVCLYKKNGELYSNYKNSSNRNNQCINLRELGYIDINCLGLGKRDYYLDNLLLLLKGNENIKMSYELLVPRKDLKNIASVKIRSIN